MRLQEIIPLYVEFIPQELEEGKFYISNKFRVAIHLCACGCKIKAVTPFNFGDDEWSLTDNNGLITLRPSIGNFMGENPYHAHYYITNNKIEWL